MSSTNRSKERHLHVADYYVTPQDAIKDFLSRFLVDEGIDRPDRLLWLDPCAGGDKNHQMSYPAVIEKEFDVDVVTTDIRPDSLADFKVDFLKSGNKFLDNNLKYDIIITNPPFNQAQEIIEKALNMVVEGGYVIMLLRLNYFGSKKRKEFWENNLPIKTYIHHKRMSFTDNGKTDSIEYMHCVWRKGVNPNFIKTKII